MSDVNILTKACLKFRKMFLEETNVCHFSEATTIASACNKVYRRRYLKGDTIGLVPKGGYRNTSVQSKIAIQWPIWEERERNINILHAAKQREVYAGNYKVDGYCPETKQVFEFLGCYIPCRLQCFNQSTSNRHLSTYDEKAFTCETIAVADHATSQHADKTRSLRAPAVRRNFQEKTIFILICSYIRSRRLKKKKKKLKHLLTDIS